MTTPGSTNTARAVAILNARRYPPLNRQPPPAAVSKQELTSLTLHMQANTTFVFQPKEGRRQRMAKFADCDNLKKLFNHARTASLFRTWAEVAPLSCKVNEAIEEICVMNDVAEDFALVVEAIKTDACWNSKSGECVVSVALAE
jgi:hypothetical protein